MNDLVREHTALGEADRERCNRALRIYRRVGSRWGEVQALITLALIEGAAAGPTVGVRADMDALPILEARGVPFASKVPGKMHACGHDVHTVIALGVAAALAEMRASLKGRIKFIFQPAEETLSGARAMIADGALDNPALDFILGYHNWPAVPAGKVGYNAEAVMSSADAFDVALKGRDGHERTHAPQNRARPVRRHRGDDEVGASDRLLQIRCDAEALGKDDIGKIDGVGASSLHVGGKRRIARPEPRLVPGAREMDRQRGPPSARAQYCNRSCQGSS